MDRGAEFSPCNRYRTQLWRQWDHTKPWCMFLMLNPSTADAEKNDPTVERCERYARRWGFGGLMVGNIFAFRATDPIDMRAQADPIGPGNDEALLAMAARAHTIVCAWGTHGTHQKRNEQVLRLMSQAGNRLKCLKVTKHGHPSHPLYLRGDLTPIPYTYPDLVNE